MSQLYVVTEFEFTLLSVFYLRFDRFILPFLCQVSQSFRSLTRSFVEQSSTCSFFQSPVFGICCQFLSISFHVFKLPPRTTLKRKQSDKNSNLGRRYICIMRASHSAELLIYRWSGGEQDCIFTVFHFEEKQYIFFMFCSNLCECFKFCFHFIKIYL